MGYMLSRSVGRANLNVKAGRERPLAGTSENDGSHIRIVGELIEDLLEVEPHPVDVTCQLSP